MYTHIDAITSDSQPFVRQDLDLAHKVSESEESSERLDEQDQLECANEGVISDEGGSLGAAFEERLLEEVWSIYQHVDWFDKHGVADVIEDKPFLQASEASIQRILSAAVREGVLDIQEGSGRRPHKYRFIERVEKEQTVMSAATTESNEQLLQRIVQKEAELQQKKKEINEQLVKVAADKDACERILRIQSEY